MVARAFNPTCRRGGQKQADLSEAEASQSYRVRYYVKQEEGNLFQQTLSFISYCVLFLWGWRLKALYTVGRHSTTELHPTALTYYKRKMYKWQTLTTRTQQLQVPWHIYQKNAISKHAQALARTEQLHLPHNACGNAKLLAHFGKEFWNFS